MRQACVQPGGGPETTPELTRKTRHAGPYGVGQRVILSNPDAPDCYRAGDEGVVVRCHTREIEADERRRRPARTERFYDVAFESDVLHPYKPARDGGPLNLGKIPLFLCEHEIEPA